MRNYRNVSICLGLVLLVASASAQNLVGTSLTLTPSAATTSTRMMLYTGLGASNYNNIVQNNDAGLLYDVNGAFSTGGLVIAPHANASSGLRFDSAGNITSYSNIFSMNNVSIGTTASTSPLSVYTASTYSGSSAATASALSVINATPNSGFITKLGYTNIGVSSTLSAADTSSKAAFYSFVSNTIAAGVGLYIDGTASGYNYGIYSPVQGLQSYFNGNVGIGVNPGKQLDVSGTIRTSGNSNTGDPGGVVYPDGTQQITAWTGVLCGGDYAEAVIATGAKKQYEPGDVLVLSSATTGSVEKSHEPYSTLVAGIYATKPGVIGRRQSLVRNSDELPMAMVGIVPTKVTAENGPIRQGDLLVTASEMGYAMKGTDRGRLVGAVLGKAMGSLTSGTGVIEVLVTLQ